MSQNLLTLTGQMKQNLDPPKIGKFHAQAIIHGHTKQGGRLMEDDFKSIPKLGAKVWQPLLDEKAITFGSPAPTA